MRLYACAALGLLLALAGCGDLPRPLAGHPGTLGRLLAAPPPARLAVPAPSGSLLADADAQAWARATAEALVNRTVPAVAHPARRGDWRLVLSAHDEGADVVPTYAIESPAGKTEGTITGAPIPTARWADGGPATLQEAAAVAAPGIANLLTSIEAARRESDPNSLINRPARILVPEVKGAPGDGDFSLAREMRLALPKNGEVVQDTKPGTDYTVQGLVHAAPGAAGTTRIEIQWVVSDARGHEAGRVVQLNEVKPGSLDHYWGDVALAVAREAAGGIRRVIDNQAHLR
jgi:hypothetical protein